MTALSVIFFLALNDLAGPSLSSPSAHLPEEEVSSQISVTTHLILIALSSMILRNLYRAIHHKSEMNSRQWLGMGTGVAWYGDRRLTSLVRGTGGAHKV